MPELPEVDHVVELSHTPTVHIEQRSCFAKDSLRGGPCSETLQNFPLIQSVDLLRGGDSYA